MKKINDSPNHPLRFIADDGRVIGQFYNSRDGRYHLSEYVPYERMPETYLCGKTGNFVISRSDIKSKQCAACFEHIDLVE
jgi:hypothetical protein